eukprot:7231526-Lingulodinium_polyedra.AAC.1
MLGPMRRVQAFLLQLLQDATRARYALALERFYAHCSQHRIPWLEESGEAQDWWAAGYVLTLRDEEASVQHAKDF